MMKRMRLFSEVVTTLVAEDLVMRALDFAMENDVHGMKQKFLFDNVETARTNGDDIKASMLIKRLAELKKVSYYILIIVQIDD